VVSRALGCSFEHCGPFLAISREGSGAQEVAACVLMISGAAGEVSGDRWEQVVLAHGGQFEQRENEIEPGLRPECSADGDGTVELHHRRRVDLNEPVVERRDP
jgi:hypothetical protein